MKNAFFHKLFSYYCLSILLLLLANCTGFAQALSKAQKIDSLLSRCHAKGIFNGVALVADDGRIILNKAYGKKNLQANTDLVVQDKFYIGSLTKQFTAMLIFQLCEQRKLDIHASIMQFLPEFRKKAFAKITIYHLLTHTSGLKNYTNFPEFDAAIAYSEAEMFAMIKRPISFNPGEGFDYSNSGYYLLGKIAERVGGASFGELLQRQIFAPLEMENSGFDTIFHSENMAEGYWRTVDGMAPMPKYAPKTLFSTGGIYSTAIDLFKWDQALYSNKLLSDSAKKIMFSPFMSDYACGWRVHKGLNDAGEYFERHQHGGMIKGYHSFILRRIPERQTVILLDNFYNQEIQEIKNAIWSILIDREGKIPQSKLSNLLFGAASEGFLPETLEKIQLDLFKFQEEYSFEEYDINTVAYRLMEAQRFSEAKLLFEWNKASYPDSWNVYDSMGALFMQIGELEEAKKMYRISLELNPENDAGIIALERISEFESKR